MNFGFSRLTVAALAATSTLGAAAPNTSSTALAPLSDYCSLVPSYLEETAQYSYQNPQEYSQSLGLRNYSTELSSSYFHGQTDQEETTALTVNASNTIPKVERIVTSMAQELTPLQEIEQRLDQWVGSAPAENKANYIEAKNRIMALINDNSETTLNLGSLSLSTLPPIFNDPTFPASRIKYLDLTLNQLTNLPPEIGQLSTLHTLMLQRNQLANLPPEIGQLTYLIRLHLSNNQLTNLPPEIGQLRYLLWLDLRDNQLTNLPPEFRQLCKLQNLNLNNNNFTFYADDIEQLISFLSCTASSLWLSTIGIEKRKFFTILVAAAALSAFIYCLYNPTRTTRREGDTTELSLADRLNNLAKLAGVAVSSELRSWIEANSAEIVPWLEKLFLMKDLLDSSPAEVKKQTALKVLHFLDKARVDETFRRYLFETTIPQSTTSCGDRTALYFIDLDLIDQKPVGEDIKDKAKVIEHLRKEWAFSALRKIADQKILSIPPRIYSDGEEVPFTEDIEVHLRYQTALNDRLGLNLPVNGMLYATCSHVTDEDLAAAEAIVALLQELDQVPEVNIGVKMHTINELLPVAHRTGAHSDMFMLKDSFLNTIIENPLWKTYLDSSLYAVELEAHTAAIEAAEAKVKDLYIDMKMDEAKEQEKVVQDLKAQSPILEITKKALSKEA